MLNAVAKLLLVLTSFAPVLLTYGFATYLNSGVTAAVFALVGLTALLVVLCLLIIRAARHQLEHLPFPISSVKSADSEIVGFMIAYLLPLISAADSTVSLPLMTFVLILFLVVVWTSNAYHVNPLLGIFGYHFYEVTTESGVTYLLMTRRSIRNSKSVSTVVQLTTYIVLDPQ